MRVRLLLARIAFAVAAVALVGGTFMIYQSNAHHKQLKSRIADLEDERDAVRKEFVETKVASKTYSKSLRQMPDSTRLENAGEISATINSYTKRTVALSNKETELARRIADVEKERANAWLRLRRDMTGTGASVFLVVAIGIGLLWSSKSAFRA